MKNKPRTDFDFSKHIVLETHFKNDNHSLDIWDLKHPEYSNMYRIRFINSCGILTVDGDFGRWSFCREFHPSADGYVSDSYWCEKLRIGSRQECSEYNAKETEKELKKWIKSGLKEYGYEGRELKKLKRDFKDLLFYVDDETEYTYRAYRESSLDDYELIPFVKTKFVQLDIIFDAFEELCKRMKQL